MRPLQREGRVDPLGHRLQLAHSLSGVEVLTLVQPSISRSDALSRLVNRGDDSDQSPPIILHQLSVSERTRLQMSF